MYSVKAEQKANNDHDDHLLEVKGEQIHFFFALRLSLLENSLSYKYTEQKYLYDLVYCLYETWLRLALEKEDSKSFENKSDEGCNSFAELKNDVKCATNSLFNPNRLKGINWEYGVSEKSEFFNQCWLYF